MAPAAAHYAGLRWSHFKHFAPQQMYEVIDQNVFPFIRGMGEVGGLSK